MSKAKSPAKPATKKAAPHEEYPVQTGQETKAVLRALSDGKSGRDWRNVAGAEMRVHQASGAGHRVQISLTEDERSNGLTVVNLEGATVKLDADYNFMLLYISKRLTPRQPLASDTRAAATIDLDDVIAAAGWVCRSTAERATKRRRVWDFIKFIARAEIVGERSGKYFDRATSEELETRIESSAWSIEEKQFAETDQPSLFTNEDEVPLTVTVIASRAWTELTTSQDLAQYLPFGDVLGAIPGGKPAGAWAKVIGLALCDYWRRHALPARPSPTRRELLEFCTPATGPVSEILTGKNPGFAVQYWAAALRILVENEFLEESGEAALSYEQHRDALGKRQSWAEGWMDGKTDLTPGPAMIARLADIAGKQLIPKARDLKQVKRGRPRKK